MELASHETARSFLCSPQKWRLAALLGHARTGVVLATSAEAGFARVLACLAVAAVSACVGLGHTGVVARVRGLACVVLAGLVGLAGVVLIGLVGLAAIVVRVVRLPRVVGFARSRISVVAHCARCTRAA